ncbi:MAG: putative Ig domain-containing protein [Myxococcaceae bacterium]
MRTLRLSLPWVLAALSLSACVEPDEHRGALGVSTTDEALFTNSGFETGTLAGWTVSTHLVALTPGVTNYPVNAESDLGLRDGGVLKTSVYDAGTPYSLIPPGLAAADTVRFPRFGNAAAVVNALGSSYNANRITQSSVVTTADIDPADGLVHVRFTVLPILQNPGHSLREQPYYYVTITNTTKGTVLSSRFNFSNEAGVPWQSNAAGSIVYTDWLLFDLPLSRSAVSIGDTLTATIIAGGCAQSGHWGEAIIDSFGSSIPGLVVYGSGPDSVEAGSDYQYTYRVLNGGTDTSTGTRLTSYLPVGVSFRSIDTPGISCTTPTVGTRGTVVCDLGAVASGGASIVKLTVRADATATGTIRHGWYFSQSNQEQPLTGPLISTNVTTGGTTSYVDLATTVDDGVGSLMWNQHGRWTITVTNRGPSTATAALVNSSVSAQLGNLSWTCSADPGASCGAASGTGNVATTVTLPAGKSVSIVLDADVGSGSGTGIVSVSALASAAGGAVERFSLDNGAGDDDTLSGTLVTVNLGRAGVGSGTLIVSPAGVSCGAGCTSTTASFASGTQVTVQAVPATGSVFSGWSGGTCSGTGACTFTAGAGQTVTGTFDRNPIVITSPATANAAVGRVFSYTVTAIGTAPVALSVSGLPAWLSFDSNTGVISGTPPSAGTTNLTLQATDVNGTATQALTITAGQPPLITSALTYTLATATTAWSTIDVNASGATPMQFNASNLPGTVSFNSTTGVFANNAGVTGVFNIPVVATNAFGSDYKTIAVSIGGAPVITSALTASGAVGSAFSYTLTATGNATIVLSVSSLPAWATFNPATGVLSGTPTSAGTLSIGLSAVNGVGSSQQTLLLTVSGPAVITSGLSVSGTAGQAFSYSMTAEGTAPLTRSIANAPAWLTFDAATGLMTGTPPSGGTFTVDMTASNAIGSDTKTLTITVTTPPSPPSITSSLTASGSVGAPFSYTITASGQAPMTFSASSLPAWATLDANTGVISGTPDVAGPVSIGLGATNAIGSDSKTLVLSIVSPAVITSATSASGITGAAFSYTLTASGVAPITLSMSGVPAWATFNSSTGELSGTAAEGVFSVSLGASNGGGSDSKTLTITIRTPPVITSALSASGVVGQAFSYTLTSSGTAPVTLSASSLPSWASFNAATGVISGTPDTEAVSSISLGASNAAGSDAQTLVLTVRSAPAITSALSASGVVGQPFSYTLTASGTAPVTLSASGLPSWASFNPSTGVLSGTPDAEAVSSISLGASNSAGSDGKSLTITIRTPPVITSPLTASGVVGQSFSYTLTTSGTAPVTLSASALPSWASFNASIGVISGTPDAEAVTSISLGASNAAGTDAQALVLTVRSAPAITSSLSASGVVGQPFSYTLTASGTAPVTLSASGLPSWASFNAATGVISGTPDAEAVSSISLGASNAAGSDGKSLVVTIRTTPAITSPLAATGVIGQPFSYTLTSSGTAPVTLDATALPSWASFNAATGLISGTPDAEGVTSISLGASNAAGTDARTLVLTVRASPLITSSLSASGVVGQAFSYTLTANGTAPVMLDATALPSWASFNAATGIISGTPDAEGVTSISLGASNAAGTDARTLVLTVRTVPRITSTLAATGLTGQPFSYVLTASGTAPLSLSIGGLPSWLSFDPQTGALTGTPVQDGVVTLTLGAGNAAGSDAKTLTLTINTAPHITNAVIVYAVAGTPFTFTLSASGTAPLAFSVGALPLGVELTGETLGGVPMSQGSYDVTESVTNPGGSDTVTVRLEVRAPIPVPVLSAPADGSSFASTQVSFAGTAPRSEAGSRVRVVEQGQFLCDAVVEPDGAWSCSAVLTEGPHAVSASLFDAHGFEGPSTARHGFTIDLTSPATPSCSGPTEGEHVATRTPRFAGTGEPGATITVTVDGAAVCTAQVDPSGAWACTASAPLPEGPAHALVTQRDAAGNESAPIDRSFIVDSLRPAQPTLEGPARSAVPSVTLSGVAEAGSTVRLTVDGVELCVTTADEQGHYACSGLFADGEHVARATATDAAGNVSEANSLRFVVDTIAPGAPVIVSPSGRISEKTPVVTGSAEPGASVVVTLDGLELCQTTADASGTWSCPVTTPLADGPHSLTARATDAAGHQGPEVSGQFEVQSASGTVDGMTVTDDGSNGTVSGTATPGATVNVYVDGVLVGTTTADSNGNWSFMLPRLTAGAHEVTVGVMGSAGEEVFRSSPQVLDVNKSDVSLGGGVGCSSTSSAPLSLLFIAAVMVLRRRRVAAVAGLAVAVVSTSALAQTQSASVVNGFELEQWQLNPSSRGGLAVGGADLLEKHDFRLNASLGYQYAPLKFFQNGVYRGALVEHRLTAAVSGAFSVFSWLELGATLPVVLYQQGEDVMSNGGELVAQPVRQHTALGTPWLQARVGVLQESSGAPLDLGLTLAAGLPLGSASALTQDTTVSGQFIAGAGKVLGPVRAALEVGAHVRDARVITEGTTPIGSRLLFSAGVSTLGGPLRFEGSVRSFVPLTALPVSAEVLGGVRYAVKDWEFFALAGPGFGNAPGTPAFRAVLGASYGGMKRPAPVPVPVEQPAPPVVAAPVVVAPPPPVEPEPVVAPAPAEEVSPPAPAVVPAQVALGAGKLELRGSVYFELNRATLQPRSFPLLDEVAAVLAAHPEVKSIRIEGHTDASGVAANNLKLSEARAQSVRTYLVGHGVAPERLEARGFGQTRPIADNATSEGREKNRRVEFIVLE